MIFSAAWCTFLMLLPRDAVPDQEFDQTGAAPESPSTTIATQAAKKKATSVHKVQEREHARARVCRRALLRACVVHVPFVSNACTYVCVCVCVCVRVCVCMCVHIHTPICKCILQKRMHTPICICILQNIQTCIKREMSVHRLDIYSAGGIRQTIHDVCTLTHEPI